MFNTYSLLIRMRYAYSHTYSLKNLDVPMHIGPILETQDFKMKKFTQWSTEYFLVFKIVHYNLEGLVDFGNLPNDNPYFQMNMF